MSPVLKLVGIGVLAATLVVAVGGLFMPSKYAVEREIVIQASPERIHQFTNDLKTWPEWTPWFKNDPTLEITLGPVTEGEGASQQWKAKKGGGQLEITRSDPQWGIQYNMDLSKGRPDSINSMRYEPMADSTKVIMKMEGDRGWNLMGRYVNLLMDPMVGPMFDDGLLRLKVLAEKPDDEQQDAEQQDAGQSGAGQSEADTAS